MGYFLLFGAVGVVSYLGWRLRRRSREVDDYYEREYKDPAIIGDLGHLGGGRFG